MGETKLINIIVFIALHMIFECYLVYYYLLCLESVFYCYLAALNCFHYVFYSNYPNLNLCWTFLIPSGFSRQQCELFSNMQDTLSCFIKTSQRRLKEVKRLHKVSPVASRIFSKRTAKAGGKFDSVDANQIFLDVRVKMW